MMFDDVWFYHCENWNLWNCHQVTALRSGIFTFPRLDSAGWWQSTKGNEFSVTSPCRHGETKTGSLLDLEIIWFGVGRAPQKRAILISLRKLIQAHWISFQFEHDISMIKIYQNECVEQSQGAHRPTAWCANGGHVTCDNPFCNEKAHRMCFESLHMVFWWGFTIKEWL